MRLKKNDSIENTLYVSQQDLWREMEEKGHAGQEMKQREVAYRFGKMNVYVENVRGSGVRRLQGQ